MICPVILYSWRITGAGKKLTSSFLINIETVKNSGCQFLWQTGKFYYENIQKDCNGIICRHYIAVYPFIDENGPWHSARLMLLFQGQAQFRSFVLSANLLSLCLHQMSRRITRQGMQKRLKGKAAAIVNSLTIWSEKLAL